MVTTQYVGKLAVGPN